MAQIAGARGVGRFVWRRIGLGPALMLGAALLSMAGISAVAAAGWWPVNGFAAAGAASRIVAEANAGREGMAGLVVPGEVGDLSLRAVTAEPASVQGARNLALFYQANGDDARATTLMRLAARLSARDTATNMWLVDSYLRAGDMPRATALIDDTLRTDTTAGALLLPRLARLLDQPGAGAVLGDMLGANPPWGHDFWSAVIEAGNAPVQAAQLRVSLHRQGVRLALGHDARLIAQLVEEQAFAEAFALYGEAHSPAAQFPPIDWRPGAGRGLAVSVSRDGEIRASALAGNAGVVAQRLLELPPGRAVLSIESDAAPGDLTARITCAQLQDERTFALAFPLTRTTRASFDQSSACRYVWLTLTLEPGTGRSDRTLTIVSASLQRAGGGA